MAPPEAVAHATPCQHAQDTRERLGEERDIRMAEIGKLWTELNIFRDRLPIWATFLISGLFAALAILGTLIASK